LESWGSLGYLSAGLSNDVFFQVGLLTTIGLSAKNAILIVEFAKENFEKGMNLVEAAKHAAGQRLRPILMTFVRLCHGCHAAGHLKRRRFRRSKCDRDRHHRGMLSATVLAIFFVPLFFVATLRLFRVNRRHYNNED